MKVLALTRYARLGASSRVRFYQMLPALEVHGIDVTVAPLSSDGYVRDLYAGKGRRPARVAGDYARRLGQLLSVGRFDLLWIEKELLPGAPAVLERLLGALRVPYAVDYDDATFHRYDQSTNPLVRRLLGSKIDVIMRHAVLVTAGNEYLAERARSAGARWTEVVPTVVDLDRYPVAPPRAEAPLTIGWMGTPITQRYLDPLRDALSTVCHRGGARILLIGADAGALAGLHPEIRAWSEQTETADIADFDVGIMPLADGVWERGKCGYKLIQYMACARPVVASPVGVNRCIVDDGVNGLLASTGAEWCTALEQLRDDRPLRDRMGRAGRARVESEYSVQALAPRLADLLRRAAGAGLTTSSAPLRLQ